MSIRNLIKKYLLILKVRNRFSAAVQIGQRQLVQTYREITARGQAVPLAETGFRVFSQFEEDGILLYIFSVIGMGNRTFVEIGSDDGVNSNCANLAFNFGWSGLFIDANATSISRGKYFYGKYPHPWMYQPTFICASVTPDNINTILSSGGLTREADFLSIDIDGDDYWIWEAIEVIRPRVVMIETFVRFGLHNQVAPYGVRYGKDHGASPVAMVKLAERKGYRLVGANQLGFNLIFVLGDLGNHVLPAVPVESVITHPSAQASMASYHRGDQRYLSPIP